jgi:hypothetical protein
MKRLEDYSRPASDVWWDGRSNEKAIERWSERAHQESDGARHRASTRKEPELPSTGEMNVHSTHGRAGDQRAAAKSDKNHVDKLSMYMRGIKRES